MSGPWAETAPLYAASSLDVATWPLRIWSDNGVATIECAECDTGEMLVASRADRPFVIADLTARVEAHMTKCPGTRVRS